MLKLLHIGDVHLDTSFHSSDPQLRTMLREGLRRSFDNAIDTCIAEGVDALLIAGDLFDNDKLSFQTEQYLIKAFNQLADAGIKVFYATGNHDPGDKSYRANRISWPSNVYLFAEDRVQEVMLLKANGEAIATIVGVGHKTNREARNLIKLFPEAKGDLPCIGLVHAMVTNAGGVEKHDRYLPCTKEELEEKGYSYWALGHIHIKQQVGESQRIYYSGNLQGRHPRETGEKGGLLVTIDDFGNTNVAFRSLSAIQWENIVVKELNEISNYHDLKALLVDKVQRHIAEVGNHKKLIIRLELQGPCQLQGELMDSENRQQLQEDLKYSLNLLTVEIKTDGLLKPYNRKALKEGRHVLANVLKRIEDLRLREELEGLETKLINSAIRSQQDKDSYIRQLLEGLEEEAIGRMVGDK